MSQVEVQTVDDGEVRDFQANGQMVVCHLSSGDLGYGIFEPGWRWSKDVKPIAGTDLCQVEHVGYVVAGQMTIQMADGSQRVIQEGDFVHIPPGHDGWVEGEDPCEMVQFEGLKDYAKKAS